MEKRHTRCLTLCSESNKHPLDLCLGQKCMQIWKQKTGRNDFKQRECLHLEFYRRWDIQWFYRSHPQIKARLSLCLSRFTSVHLSFAYVEFLRLTLYYRQFLKPNKSGGRKQDTAVELWWQCCFPKILTCWKPPQEPGLGDYSPISHIQLRFLLKYETMWMHLTHLGQMELKIIAILLAYDSDQQICLTNHSNPNNWILSCLLTMWQ